MNEANRRTLASYDQHVPEYVAGTSNVVSGFTKKWIDAALDGLSRDVRIFELGSGHGRDAAYIEKLGYALDCSDATPAFVEHLRSLGLEARHFDALSDALSSSYDLILANAVLLHFNRQQFSNVLAKMSSALKPCGRFAFTLKQGDGEEWSYAKLNAPRYFCYWQPADVPVLLSAAGFSSWSVDAERAERTHADWISVLAKKECGMPECPRCRRVSTATF